VEQKDDDVVVHVEVAVKNTGDREGKTVVQLYVKDEEAAVPRPLHELKEFKKVSLMPQEEKTVTFDLDKSAFSYYYSNRKSFYLEPGSFTLEIGESSRDIRCSADIFIK
jgi:beta-glucosidase